MYFFGEYNFSVEYKPRRLGVVANELSRRHYFEPSAPVNSDKFPTVAALTASVTSSPLLEDVRKLIRRRYESPAPDGSDCIFIPKILDVFAGSIPFLFGSVYDSRWVSVLYSRCRRLVSSFPRMIICDCESCLNVTMKQQVGILVVRRLTSR